MDMKSYTIKGSLLISVFAVIFFLVISSCGSGSSETKENRETIDNQTAEEIHEPDVIIIDNEGYEKDIKGPSRFEHLKHARDYGISCWECHHDYDDGKNMWKPWDETGSCTDCHLPDMDMDAIVKLQDAYHMKCKTCHEEKKIFGSERLAYSKCVVCHEAK